MVSEKTIYRMLEKNILPAVRVGGQWRFRKKDIDSWIDRQVRKVEIDGDRRVLAEFEQSEIEIALLLEEENIWLETHPMSRDEVLTWMILHAKLEEGVDRKALTESVLLREQICSTAIVESAAFPHPNNPATFRFSRKRVLVAIMQQPINYLDPHGHMPNVVVMILARTVQGYLLTLSRAIKLFQDFNLIDRLRKSKTPEEVIRIIREAEDGLRNISPLVLKP
jgi:PTS system nitrogen regulatory IIA component